MLANTMMSGVFNHGGKLTGACTVLDFTLSVAVVLIETGGKVSQEFGVDFFAQGLW